MADHAGRRLSATLALLAAAALAVAGCGGATPTSAPADPDLAGRILQSRFDQASDSIRVQVANEGDQPVRVDDLVLNAPPFPAAPSENQSRIPPGQRIDFRVEYGQPTCESTTPTPAAATARVVIDGRPVEVDVEDPQDVLTHLLTMLCGQQRLAEFVTVNLGKRWTADPDGDGLLGTIVIRRNTGRPVVTLDRIAGGSVVFDLEPVRGAPATLPAGQDELSVPILATAQRCEPHARADDKLMYEFPVWLSVAGEPEPISVDLEVPVNEQPTFDSLCDAATTAGVEP